MKENTSENEESSISDNHCDSNNSSDSNKIETSNGDRILVFVRIRPFLEFEKKFDDNSTPITNIDLNNNSITCKQI